MSNLDLQGQLSAKKYNIGYSDAQTKLLHATDNNISMPTQSDVVQIAQMTFNRYFPMFVETNSIIAMAS